MSDLKDRIVSAQGSGGDSLREAIAAAVSAPPQTTAFRESYGVTVDEDEDEWRRLTGDSRRDLSPLTQERMRKLAYYLWESNLLANRIVELPLAYMLAEGVRLVGADEIIQEVLDRFWKDPINNFDIKLVSKVRELSLYGEQCWPTFVNELTGHVRLGYLDPSLIETVVTDPDNAEQPIGIVTTKDKHGQARRYRVIVNGSDAELFTQRTQEIRKTFTDGEAFFFAVNKLSNGRRGRSDLLAQADWLDSYDQFLFGEIDRAQFLRAFIWDVTLKGATPDEVKERAKQIATPPPGSIRVHNDAETWTAESPNLNSYQASDHARLFRNHVLGGATLPEVWYGGGGDVNRAAAAEMGDPTFKMFTMRQTFIGYILEEVGRYVIRQWELANSKREPDLWDPVYGVQAEWPEMVASDITKYAAALQQVAAAASMVVSEGFMTKRTAVAIIEKIAGRLGVEFDAQEELDKALEEYAKTKEEDVFHDLPPDPADQAAQPAEGAANA